MGEDGNINVSDLWQDIVVLDDLQVIRGTQPSALEMVLPIEISLPEPSEKERKKEDSVTVAHEGLCEEIEKIHNWT